MSVEQAEIEKIAALARIRIAESDIADLGTHISNILSLVDQMQAIDTRDVEPMANPLDACQRLRRDKVTESDRHREFQALAPVTEDALYLVPRVLE